MSASAKILADSMSPDGVRLTTFEVVLARPALAEFNTHRVLSRSSASSRAVPFEKMIARVLEDPYIPAWTRNQKGMQGELLDPDSVEYTQATKRWLALRDEAISAAHIIGDLGVHKQDVNRALEPWIWHTIIVTATEWDNFWHLRDHTAAYIPMQQATRAMRAAYAESVPVKLDYGQWHLPYYDDADGLAFNDRDPGALPSLDLIKASVGRCARVSYLTQDGERDVDADIKLHDRLLAAGHMAPFEHVARPMAGDDLFKGYLMAPSTGRGRTFADMFSGNFRGWVQYRKMIPHEHDILGAR